MDKPSKRKYTDSYLSLTHATQNKDGGAWRGNAHHPEVNWISALSEPTLLPPYFAGSNTSNLIKRLESGHGGTKLTPQEYEKWLFGLICLYLLSETTASEQLVAKGSRLLQLL